MLERDVGLVKHSRISTVTPVTKEQAERLLALAK